ncbi:MAG TPA: response regulator [Pyrinomonadaceae bacterium]|jgi:CheY-like chemotaxis protein
MKESVLLRGRKLLLADDSLAIQKVIELTFEDEGMQVVCVGNGRQAVERLEEARPDIVLADVFMPELNGYEVCERIKGNEQFRHVPVILLVGSFEPFNEAEARRVGADDYLTKPFQSIRQMVSKVGALLSGNKSQAEAATQKLPAQKSEQSQSESHARMDNLELTTADTAPLPQQMRPADESHAAPAKPYAELQLDDAMIEETPANKFGSAGQTSAISQQEATNPLSPQELAEVGVQTAATATTTGHQLTNTGAGLHADEAREAATTAATAAAPPSTASASATARSANRAAASDDALLDLDDVEMPRSSAHSEADDFILDLQDEADAQPSIARSSSSVSPSYQSAPPAAQQSDMETDTQLAEEMTEAAPLATEFVEAQFAGSEQRAEFATVEEPQASAAESYSYPQASAANAQATGAWPDTHEATESAQEPPTYEPQEPPAREAESASATAAASTGAATASSQAGQIGLEQLSPEAIDAIARRVVEQLSTQVVEQIAWEVVPQLAELLVKRRLEEEGKQ